MRSRQSARSDRALPDDRLELEYIPASAALSRWVTTFYHLRRDEPETRDIQPASVGHLTFFPLGLGAVRFRDGQVHPNHRFSVLSPTTYAATIEVAGPFHAIGAALTPTGWAALTGMPADEHGNRMMRASEVLTDDAVARGEAACAAYRDGSIDGPAMVALLSELIVAHADDLPPAHQELIDCTNRWLGSALDPPLDDLFEACGYSRRQVQRLVERYFGMPPVSLKRKYRALRAAALYSLPQLTPEVEASLGEAFYDQSHMIRELRLFVGRTPAKLGEDDEPYHREMLNLRNFREIEPDASFSERPSGD